MAPPEARFSGWTLNSTVDAPTTSPNAHKVNNAGRHRPHDPGSIAPIEIKPEDPMA